MIQISRIDSCIEEKNRVIADFEGQARAARESLDKMREEVEAEKKVIQEAEGVRCRA